MYIYMYIHVYMYIRFTVQFYFCYICLFFVFEDLVSFVGSVYNCHGHILAQYIMFYVCR